MDTVYHPDLTSRAYIYTTPASEQDVTQRRPLGGLRDDPAEGRTWEGWLYLSFVLDTYSRKVVGWSMANNLRTELVLGAVNWRSTLAGRRPG
jgi:transposase InsO family protein